MFAIILVFFFLVLVCLLGLFFVLLQNPKDQGGYDTFGTGAVKQLVGTAQTTNFLQKITYTLIFCYFSFALLGSFLLTEKYSSTKVKREDLKKLEQKEERSTK